MLPSGLDLGALSNLAAMLGVPAVSVPPEASDQDRHRAVASAVVAEAAHKQQEREGPGGPNSNLQGDVNAAAATFLQGLLGAYATRQQGACVIQAPCCSHGGVPIQPKHLCF